MSEPSVCPCGSGNTYAKCCQPIHKGEIAKTAEQIMRARYSAYETGEIEFLGESLHPDHREDYDPEGTAVWARESSWLGLTVADVEQGGEDDDEGVVVFYAKYKSRGVMREHREAANFKKHEGAWYYTDGYPVNAEPARNENKKVGRNDPCPCGSGKKYKKCCGR